MKGQELMQGAIDLHVHPGPDLVERPFDDAELAQLYKDAGFRGFVVKSPRQDSADRVYYVRKMVPGIDVFGSISLNYAVGGFNPFAVDTAIGYGAKVVFGPNKDAYNHKAYEGTLGKPSFAPAVSSTARAYAKTSGIKIWDDNERILPEVDDVLDIIAEANVALSVGHLSPPEAKALIKRAKEHGVRKIWVDHPFEHFMGMAELEVQREITELGAYLLLTSTECSMKYHVVTPEQVAHHMKELGPGRLMIGTDAGQPVNPAAPEAMRLFVVCLMELGVPSRDLQIMVRENPARMLYDVSQ